MGATLAIVLVAMTIGLGIEMRTVAGNEPGMASTDVIAERAGVLAGEYEVFAAACTSAAAAAPGATSSNLPVVLPPGVAMPAGATCITSSNGSGRDVFAVVPDMPGVATRLIGDGFGAVWWDVKGAQVVNMASGAPQAIPGAVAAAVASGGNFQWITVNP